MSSDTQPALRKADLLAVGALTLAAATSIAGLAVSGLGAAARRIFGAVTSLAAVLLGRALQSARPRTVLRTSAVGT